MDLGVQVFRLWEESLPQMKKKQLLLGTIWAGLVVVMMAATGVWSGLGLRVALLALGVVVVTAALGSLSLRSQVARAHRTCGSCSSPSSC